MTLTKMVNNKIYFDCIPQYSAKCTATGVYNTEGENLHFKKDHLAECGVEEENQTIIINDFYEIQKNSY